MLIILSGSQLLGGEQFLLGNPLLSVQNSKRIKAAVHNYKPSLYSSRVGKKPVLIDGSQRLTNGRKHLKERWLIWMWAVDSWGLCRQCLHRLNLWSPYWLKCGGGRVTHDSMEKHSEGEIHLCICIFRFSLI